MNQIVHGDCLDHLRTLDADSIDLICTDPPYGVAFMQKKWDKAVPSVEIWKECLRVLKPGAFAFVMSLPRQDCLARMIVNLEDAGFVMAFSPIFWAFACLSDDTEILTKNGWERLQISNKILDNNGIISEDSIENLQGKEILIYDTHSRTYKWEVPNKWNVYQLEDTCYRVQSNYTDQLVTRNHRIAIEQDGEIIFNTPEELQEKRVERINIPYLEDMQSVWKNFYNSPIPRNKSQKKRAWRQLLQPDMQWEGSVSLCESVQQNARNLLPSFLDRGQLFKLSGKHVWRKKPGMEGRHHVHAKKRVLLQRCFDKIRAMSARIFRNGSQRWVCDGASFIGRQTNKPVFAEIGGCSSFRPQSSKQRDYKSRFIQKQLGSQKVGTRGLQYKTTLAVVSPEHYRGIVFCPTVSTGCFVARRHGKIFITGNSGFPKAANMSKLADKRKGMTREVVGEYQFPDGNRRILERTVGVTDIQQLRGNKHTPITVPASPEAHALNGAYAGFQPKPAAEVVLVAMKPLDCATYLDQALTNGKGVTWLDDGRIPLQGIEEHATPGCRNSAYMQMKDGVNQLQVDRLATGQNTRYSQQGRFPANLLVSDGILTDGRITHDTFHKRNPKGANLGGNGNFGQLNHIVSHDLYSGYTDSGTFSRYFDLDAWFGDRLDSLPEHVRKTFPFLIVPKPSKREKNAGLEAERAATVNDGRQTPIDNPFQRGDTPRQNTHPTVKPVKLFSYLLTIGSRPGDVVLDPFAGSGTTGVACALLGRQAILIEREQEYVAIIEKRMAAHLQTELAA